MISALNSRTTCTLSLKLTVRAFSRGFEDVENVQKIPVRIPMHTHTSCRSSVITC